jgi:hypothetical protein
MASWPARACTGSTMRDALSSSLDHVTRLVVAGCCTPARQAMEGCCLPHAERSTMNYTAKGAWCCCWRLARGRPPSPRCLLCRGRIVQRPRSVLAVLSDVLARNKGMPAAAQLVRPLSSSLSPLIFHGAALSIYILNLPCFYGWILGAAACRFMRRS